MTAPISVGVDATTWWNDRGFGRFTRGLLTELARRDQGFRYTLVVDCVPDAGELPDSVDVLPITSRRCLTEAAVQDGARSPLDMLRLGLGVARQSFDLFFFPAVYSYFPLLRPVPTVVAFHDTIAERYPGLVFPTRRNELLWRAKVALARWQARRVMTVSNASARDLVDILGVDARCVDLVTEGASPIFRVLPADEGRGDVVLRRHRLPHAAPMLIYVGGLSPHKNLLSLLKAMPEVLRRHPDAHLAIVGDTSGKGFHDNYSELEGFVAATAGLVDRVRFTGYVSDDDLVSLYNRASALVLPSLWEGFGLPAVEAMSCGLPVLASRRASLPEVVGDAGLLFDPEMPSDIARSICELLDSSALAHELSKRARARACLFTWAQAAGLAENSFHRCLDPGR